MKIMDLFRQKLPSIHRLIEKSGQHLTLPPSLVPDLQEVLALSPSDKRITLHQVISQATSMLILSTSRLSVKGRNFGLISQAAYQLPEICLRYNLLLHCSWSCAFDVVAFSEGHS